MLRSQSLESFFNQQEEREEIHSPSSISDDKLEKTLWKTINQENDETYNYSDINSEDINKLNSFGDPVTFIDFSEPIYFKDVDFENNEKEK